MYDHNSLHIADLKSTNDILHFMAIDR